MSSDIHSVIERARVHFEGADSVEAARVRNSLRAALLDAAPEQLVIARFVVLERLGSGGMGIVYAGYDRELDRRVAIKLTHRFSDREGDHERARVLREARALAQLSHPNVVAIYDVGELRDRVFIAMELVVGETLREHARRTRRWRDILRVYRQAGEGLAAAHAAGIVHRDFKPDNALLGADGRVRVLDFGLAHGDGERIVSAVGMDGPHGEDTRARTGSGKVAGTPAYMAPEQHEGGITDARTDQFAFCVSLWEALHGERPFEGVSLVQLWTALADGRITPPPASSSVPAWLRRVLTRGLAYEPARRWPSMEALLAALAHDPTARRRGYLSVGVALGATLGVTGLATGVVALQRASARAECTTAAEAITTVWNDAAAARIREAFAATGLPYANAAAQRVDDELARHATRWSAVHERACLARGTELDEPGWRLRVDCLDEHAERVGALVDTLATADHEVVQRAVELAFALPPGERCEDDARLARAAAALGPDVDRESVAQLRRTVARARALTQAGQADDAVELAAAAQASAIGLGDPALRSEAELALADAVRQAGDYDDALAEYQRAYFTALAIGADEVALAAATGLLNVTGFDLSRFEEARTWHRHAEVLLDRVEGTSTELAAGLARAFASVQRRGGDGEGAEASYRHAIALFSATIGREHPRVGEVSISLAGLLVERGDLEQATALLDEAEPILAAGYGDDALVLANVNTTRFLIAYLQTRFAEASTRGERALAILEQWHGPDHPSVATALANLAELRQVTGDDRGARALLVRALAIRRARLPAGHPDIAQTIENLGLAELYLGDLDAALTHVSEGLSLRRIALSADHPGVVYSLLHLAEVHLARHEPNDAVTFAQEAEAIAARGGPAVAELHGRALASIGHIELARARPHHAIVVLERALSSPYGTSPDAATRCELHLDLARAWRGVAGDPTREQALVRAARTACDEAGDRALDASAELARWPER